MPRLSALLALSLLLLAAGVRAQDADPADGAASGDAVETNAGLLQEPEADEVLPGDGPEGQTALESGEVALDEGEGVHGDADAHGEGGEHGPAPPVWLVIPFALLLLMIATGPLFYPHFWHHHYPKVAIGLGVLVAAFYVLFLRSPGEIVPTAVVHAAEEYFSFIALLGALFVASGTILIRTDYPGTPKNNAVLLFAGAVLSNFIGTTGASMLLIRPFMRLNAGRLQAYHIIFFIFVVSNVGGALTPIGDPPLFLGFLRGVPFFWTVTHLWYIWLPTILAIIAVFCVIDARNKTESVREEAEDEGVDVEPGEVPGAGAVPGAPGIQDVADHPGRRHAGPPKRELSIDGKMGFVWLAVVIASVFLDPNIFGWVPDLHELAHLPFGIREIIMFGVCVAAYKTAKPEALRGNDFNFEPIKEVGYLFIGIFLTMQPALTLIGQFAAENRDALGVTSFYFGTGMLSGVLDNAPTYVSFLSAAMGKFGLDVNVPTMVSEFAMGADPSAGFYNPATTFYLEAISIAAVFFGALTYIGNGPNFMVKAIAESSGVQTPSFVAYVVKYSLPILIPIYAIVWLVFFSGYVLPHPVDLPVEVILPVGLLPF